MPPGPIKHRPTDNTHTCPYCGISKNARGFSNHVKACEREHNKLHRRRQVVATLDADASSNMDPGHSGMFHISPDLKYTGSNLEIAGNQVEIAEDAVDTGGWGEGSGDPDETGRNGKCHQATAGTRRHIEN
jgi:hypothetical protein